MVNNNKRQKGLVSVIIPLFNRVDYIADTINSVLSQDYNSVELIVVDDGSTDGSYELAEGFEKIGELRLLTHENRVNKGQAAAINLGLKEATGEFIAILDSDDMFADGKIKLQVEYLDINPDVGLVYGMGHGVDAKGKYIYDIHNKDHIEPNDPNEVLLDCYFLLPQNSLVRHSVYDVAGNFNESYRSAQDHDMQIRIAEVTKMAFIPKLCFYYRRHGDSISVKGLETRWRAGLKILESAKKRYPYTPKTIRKRRAVLNYHLAKALFKSKSHLFEALIRIILSGMLDPIRAFKVVTGLEKNY
jgi:glycosyltransferase involved in cell wall biosynthesis